MFDWLPRYFDGTLREHYLLLFGAAASIALVSGIVSAWIGAHFGARRGVRHALRNDRAHQLATGDRLDRLTDAVDAIALEVERISEAQRYTAKLLSERPASPIPPARREAERITPH